MKLLINWVVRALLVLMTAYLIPGFNVVDFWGAVILVLVLAILNVAIKPILVILTLPINLMTLGLFTLIINALVLGLADFLVPGVSFDSWGTTFLASLVLSGLSFVVNILKK